MISLVLRRTLGALPLLLGVATLVFLALSLAPGDPAALYIPRGASPEDIEQLRRTFGLDGPFLVRYFRWLGAFLQGDFGISFHSSLPVRNQILAVLPNTLVLAGTSLFLAFLFGGAIGVLQAVRQGKFTDSLLSVVTLFFYSMPSFWLGLMLILFFSVGAGALWDWPFSFPTSGTVSAGAELLSPWGQLKDRIHHLVLPCVTLTLILAGGWPVTFGPACWRSSARTIYGPPGQRGSRSHEWSSSMP